MEKEILAEVRPTSRDVEEVHRVVSKLIDELKHEAKERGIPGEPLLVGSVAKDTFLKEPEIDVFFTFPDTTSRKDLERWGLELGEVLDKASRRYAEHPYTHGLYMDYEVDVVPCYKLKEPSARMTAVDRTPFHLVYVRGNLEERQKDEVRLLKRFMKGTGTYGAEARVQGFSGYLCELLVLKFGAFGKLLQEARSWRPPVHLQLEMEAKRGFDEPLVFVDPVDGERNAASAVSLDSLSVFIHAATEYLRDPHRTFYFPEEPTPKPPGELRDEMKRRGTAFLAVSSSAPDLSEDILFPQLRKAEQSIVGCLTSHDFRLLRSRPFLMEREWCVMLEVEIYRLPNVKKHSGPPPWLKNAYSFTSKWESSPDLVAGPYIEAGRLMVEIKRKQIDAARTLQHALPSLSLGKHLNEAVQGSFEIHVGEELLESGYGDILTQFLTRQFPWRIRRA